VQQDFAALVTGGFQSRLDQVDESDVNHRQFELNVSEVPR
jgi:hypothetical protein